MNADRFGHDRFHVKQLIRPLVNLYEVRALGPASDAPGEVVAFVRQKRAAIKEDIRAFSDDSESEELFRIKARSVFDLGGRYNVTDSNGEPIGALEKVFGKSLLRSTWRVLAPDDAVVFTAAEKSMAVAIGRRVVELVPYGELLPIPYHFSFVHDGTEIGGLRRILGFRDQYELDLGGDAEHTVDRRLAVSLALGLDALQSR